MLHGAADSEIRAHNETSAFIQGGSMTSDSEAHLTRIEHGVNQSKDGLSSMPAIDDQTGFGQ